jgi:GNAT superfamily N-acetyltransferase
MLMMGFALPYVADRLDALGYRKAKDLVAYDYNVRTGVTPRVEAVMRRASMRPEVGLRKLDRRRFAEELALIVDIFNDAWSQNWGFVPFTPAELAAVAKALKPIVREELVAVATLGGEPASMIVALPNLYETIADLDGRLLPFGWAKLLWRLKFELPGSARVALLGVRKKYQGRPIGSVLMLAACHAFREGMLRLNIDEAELSWILEDNMAMRSVLEAMGARIYKTYRVYEKPLDWSSELRR